MRDRSKQLLVINTGKKESEQTRLPAQSGTTHIIGGGGLSVNMSDYLLKSIWDKVWEIRTDSQGAEYIFGKLPVVLQYGITMYSGDGVDVPSLASGLPFDGRTIWYNPDTQQIEVIGGTGGGSGEGVSNFWDLSGIPSWITNSKPKYTYSEIEGTPDLTQYALVSQIPSLSGYATESWVLQKNYATKATTLSGYGITDAYTKTNVDDLIKSYVTLGGTQTITGDKNFTGGLKVNGSPIYYDIDKKYWKLEGDLLVTGGVTMYGSDSSFTPSTIMDALLYDDATLGINSNGQLYVKGGTSGGGLDITALQNYLTQNSYLNVTSGDNRYLKLSGGTITGSENDQVPLAISNTASTLRIGFVRNNEVLGYLGFIEANKPLFYDTDGNGRLLLHERNYSSYALPLSGGTMTGNILLGGTTTNKIGTNIVDTTSWQEFTHQNSYGYIALGPFNDSVAHIYTDRPTFYFNKELYVNGAKVWNAGNDGSGSTLDADLLDGKQGSYYEPLFNYSPTLLTDSHNLNNYAKGYYGYKDAINPSNSFGNNTAVLALQSVRGSDTWQIAFDGNNIGYTAGPIIGIRGNFAGQGWTQWFTLATVSSNVASATKLQTARTIWGQSFDGTGNVSGVISGVDGISFNSSNAINIDYNSNFVFKYTHLQDWSIQQQNTTKIFMVRNDGNVGIGTTSPKGKLDINGSIWVGAGDYIANRATLILNSNSGAAADIIFKSGSTTKSNYGWWAISSRNDSTGSFAIFRGAENGANSSEARVFNIDSSGSIGIGTDLNVGYKFAVNGDSVTNHVRTTSVMFGHSDVSSSITSNRWYYASITYVDEGQSPSYLNPALVFKTMNNTYQSGTEVERMRLCSNGNLSIGYAGNKGTKLYVDGSILASGGITMYSDQRKKTILNHVELSLKDIANAPLIEHYYNSDEKKTTHVGSIAQYWASMNDWFCKLDSEGYYTMEIQNAALASAISIARELDRYETKTDKDIKKLKKRICELEEEVERLKSA